MSQDLTFSQFYENPLLRNPALAGVFNGDIRVSGTLRNQWESVTVPYKTQAFGTEVKFPINERCSMTGGLEITNDVAGDINLNRVQFLPVANVHILTDKLSKSYISVAVMGGIVTSQFDPSSLKLGDQYDPTTGGYNPNSVSNQRFNKTSFNYRDLSTGFSWSSSFELGHDQTATYYAGLGIFHLLTDRVLYYNLLNAETDLSKKWVLNGGLTLPFSDDDEFIIYGDYLRQAGNRQFMLGAMYGNNVFRYLVDQNSTIFDGSGLYGGLFYRWNDALVPTVKIDLLNFSFGFSYDVNVSQLQSASQNHGGFECTLSYKALLPGRPHEESFDDNGGYNKWRNHLKCITGPVF